MTAATASQPDVAAYLAAVRAALADLPAAERDDLVAEVEASLAEAAADPDASLVAQLGPPEAFAADLRAAAGFQAAGEERAPSGSLRDDVRELARRVQAHPRYAPFARAGRELAPIWWVLRGYVAVALFAFIVDADWSTTLKLVPVLGTALHALVAIAVAVVVSVALGLVMRLRGRRSVAVAVANAVLAIGLIPVGVELADDSAQRALVAAAYETPAPPQPGLVYDGVRVENIYPFSRDGKLLHDVLLYDGSGRPLEIASDPAGDPDRRFVFTVGNRPLFNAFPIRYYEPGTLRVARPNAKPPVKLPRVVTPPLGGSER